MSPRLRQARPGRAGLSRRPSIHDKLAASDPGNTDWQRDPCVSHHKLGDVARAEQARQARAGLSRQPHDPHGGGQRDPGNTDWQRDLSGSYDRPRRCRLRPRQARPGRGRPIATPHDPARKLAPATPGNNSSGSAISASPNKLGDVACAQVSFDQAAQAYRDGLTIRKHW